MIAPDYQLSASACLETLTRVGFDHIVTVPDWVQLALHTRLEAGANGITLIATCNENQGVTVAAGLTISGKTPLVMIQNQGFYNCVNTLRAIGLDAHIPTVLMIGQFGREYANIGQEPSQSRRNMVRLLEPVLDTLKIRHWRLDSPVDLARVHEALAHSRNERAISALLVGAPIAWS